MTSGLPPSQYYNENLHFSWNNWFFLPGFAETSYAPKTQFYPKNRYFWPILDIFNCSIALETWIRLGITFRQILKYYIFSYIFHLTKIFSSFSPSLPPTRDPVCSPWKCICTANEEKTCCELKRCSVTCWCEKNACFALCHLRLLLIFRDLIRRVWNFGLNFFPSVFFKQGISKFGKS